MAAVPGRYAAVRYPGNWIDFPGQLVSNLRSRQASAPVRAVSSASSGCRHGYAAIVLRLEMREWAPFLINDHISRSSGAQSVILVAVARGAGLFRLACRFSSGESKRYLEAGGSARNAQG